MSTNACRRFLIFMAHAFFSWAVSDLLNASPYFSWSENKALARLYWWSIFFFPPPFPVDAFPPLPGKSPCLITSSSVRAVMSFQVRSTSDQLNKNSFKIYPFEELDGAYSTPTPSSASESLSTLMGTGSFLLFFEAFFTGASSCKALGVNFIFLFGLSA